MPVLRARTTAALIGAGVSAAVCAVAIGFIPPDARLGSLVRLVMFHGALTWATMAGFACAAIASIGYCAGHRALLGWAEVLRWLSLGLWLLNTGLSVVSMRIAWGGIVWDEPRVYVTLGVLAGASLAVALGLIADKPTVSAVLDVALAIGVWGGVLSVSESFHPASPVFSSGQASYIAPFVITVVALVLVMVCLAVYCVQRRISL